MATRDSRNRFSSSRWFARHDRRLRGVVIARRKEIAESVIKHRLPIIFAFRQNVEAEVRSVRIDRLDPWLGPTNGGTNDCADEVTLSRKGANSPTRARKLRSTGTKANARASNRPNSLSELKKQLETRTRELAEVRGHLSEALEQQTAASLEERAGMRADN